MGPDGPDADAPPPKLARRPVVPTTPRLRVSDPQEATQVATVAAAAPSSFGNAATEADGVAFQVTVEQAATGIAHIGLDGCFRYVNLAWCAMTGYTREALLQLNVADITYPDDLAAEQGQVRQLLAGSLPSYEVDQRYARRDGQVVWVHRTVSLVRTSTGAPAYYIALIEDIGARKHLEQELAARAQQLEATTAQLEAVLSITGHELRGPLATLTTALQLARRRLAPLLAPAAPQHGVLTEAELAHLLGGVQALLERALSAAGRADRLVGDLVDTAGIRAGHLELHPAPCDLGAVVQEAVEEQRQQQPDRTIDLDRPAASVPVVADARRLGQVVTNYLTNALKYSAVDRPVVVQVGCEAGTARVAVRDEGPGLLAEEREQVWAPFHRVPGIQVRSGPAMSLGLGLHICKTLIERQGGQVGVDSALGEGSTFWFTLPLAAQATPQAG